jgi:hypothetical protein
MVLWEGSGEDIVRRIGSSFGLLPIGGVSYVCEYHRGKLSEEELRRIARETYLEKCRQAGIPPTAIVAPLSRVLECETREFWPKGVPRDAVANFPETVLPDGRAVVCVPRDTHSLHRPAHILPDDYHAVVEAAMRSRGVIALYAQEAALSRLQAWRTAGVESVRRFGERQALMNRGRPMTDEEDPFRGFPFDGALFSWISHWHPELWKHPGRRFTPSVEAWNILGGLLGLSPETVRSWTKPNRMELGTPASEARKAAALARESEKRLTPTSSRR